MKTRDQAIVAAISNQEKLLTQAGAGRYVVSLPGMLQRHGLLQTLAFLQRKAAAANEGEAAGNLDLLRLMELGVAASSGMAATNFSDGDALRRLSALPLGTYLHLSEVAVTTATWIKRLHEARATVEDAEQQRNARAGAP